MKVHLDYRNPSPSHCNVAVFIDGANCGTLTLRQADVLTFQMILTNGMNPDMDQFHATGDPGPDPTEPAALGRWQRTDASGRVVDVVVVKRSE